MESGKRKNIQLEINTNVRLVTRYIKHLAESANFKLSTFNKHCNGLIGIRFEMPNVSYTHPLVPMLRKRDIPTKL